MEELSLMQRLAAMALPLIFAVTVHEAAHGWVADKLGDKTARSLGRITFNPIPHIDPVGTLLVPLGLYALSALAGGPGLLFGWAKPVPVDMRKLHNPKRDMGLVALAGPGANLVMAVLWALAILIAGHLQGVLPAVAHPLIYMAFFGVLINCFLMVLNLLPILPLDGGRVLASLMPLSLAVKYAKLEPWGLVILLVLLFGGMLGPVILPMVYGVQHGIYALIGL